METAEEYLDKQNIVADTYENVIEVMESYADQVSRERAIEFAKYYKNKILKIRDIKDDITTGDHSRLKFYNEWREQL